MLVDYVTEIYEQLKKEYDNPTVWLLLCQDKDRLIYVWKQVPKHNRKESNMSYLELFNLISNMVWNKRN